MPANDRMSRLWSRRSLLVMLAAGSMTALSGCRVQLEEDAPRLPLVPTRVPMKDERALLAVLGRTTSLGLLTAAVGSPGTSMTGQLSAIHASQVAVIERLLREGGVPSSTIGAAVASRPTTPPTSDSVTAPAPTSTLRASGPTSSSPTTRPLSGGSVLIAAEGDSVRDVSLADISSAHVALIGSMLAQRVAAVSLLGGRAAPPVRDGVKGAEALRLLDAARAAVYGFEIVTAQIDRTGRGLAMSTLATLRARAAELETLVGSLGTAPPLGYQLPFAVTDTHSARRLGQRLLQALLTSQAACFGPATGDAAALASLVQSLGATEVIASRWGAPSAAFPGLGTR